MIDGMAELNSLDETTRTDTFDPCSFLVRNSNIFSDVTSCNSDATTSNFLADQSTELQDYMFLEATLNHEQISLHTVYDAIQEQYMMSPLSEIGIMKIEHSDDFWISEEAALMNSNDLWLYFAIQQFCPLLEQSAICNYYQGVGIEDEGYNPSLYLTSSHDLMELVPSYRPLQLQSEEPQKRQPITLVLDLDETLVHSTLDTCEDADFSFPVHLSMQMHTVYVRQRPYLRMFLEAVAGMFDEIVIFTAGQSMYAEKLLDVLDPDHTLIGQRIYRDSCVFSESGYVKDLTILNRDLAKIAIVDNSPQVFQLQVENGIPIESWFGDPSDNALISLLFFLQTLVDAEDVRPIIKQKFGAQE